MRPIHRNVPSVPAPTQPYRHVSYHGRRLMLAGQVPMSLTEKDVWPSGEIKRDTLNILTNIECVLRDFGADRRDILRVRVFLTDFERDFAGMNSVYGEFFGGINKPARTCVGVASLPRNSRVEVEVDAIQPWSAFILRYFKFRGSAV